MAADRAYALDVAGGRSFRAPSRDDWWLALLVAAESVFTVMMLLFEGVTVDEALMAAGSTSALAAGAIYAKPALLQIGAHLRLRAPDHRGCEQRRQVLPKLVVLVHLELAIVGVGVLGVGLDTSGALRLAAGITLVSMAICHGQPALLAVGRRIFRADGPM